LPRIGNSETPRDSGDDNQAEERQIEDSSPFSGDLGKSDPKGQSKKCPKKKPEKQKKDVKINKDAPKMLKV
jgi:hypothetical protein